VRRYGRTVVFIAVLVTLATLILAFQTITIGNFERGNDTPLGLSLGLDLQGGSHLVYQAALRDPDTDELLDVSEDQMEALKRTIERRVNASGLGEPIIQILKERDRLLIQLPGVTDPDRAKSLIGETARLEFKRRSSNVLLELDEFTEDDIVSVVAGLLPGLSPKLPPFATTTSATSTAGSTATFTAGATATSTATSTAPLSATSTGAVASGDTPAPVAILVQFTEAGAAKFELVLDRLAKSYKAAIEAVLAQGVPPEVARAVANPSRLDVTVEGVEQLRFETISPLRLDSPTTFAFLVPPTLGSERPPTLDEVRARVGEDAKIFFSEFLPISDEDIGLTGDDLARAFPSQHAQSGAPIINIEFNDKGTRIFAELTQDIVRKQQEGRGEDQIAIFLDDEQLIAPGVNTPITAGTGIITSPNFTIERVREVALLLESGRLPIPIELIRERDVDAILGKDSLEKSVVAGFVGLGLVLLFTTLYYRLPGVVASVTLLIYVGLVLAIFKIIPVTLTLSGVAAVILSVGMAVDANILIFERMKEELRAGRTLLSSINLGFDRAWPAIRDGNVSTLITCAILYWFADRLGATIVQGFAITLAIGVLVSMFSAITITRTLLRLVSTTGFSRRTNWWTPSGRSGVAQQVAAPAGQRS